MNTVYWARFFRGADDRWSADVPDMPGCLTWGHTIEEAYRYLLEEAIPCWLGNDPWPLPRGPEEALAAERQEGQSEPLLVGVEVGGRSAPEGDSALPAPLAADLARAAVKAGRPAAEILAQAAREYLERHANGQL